MAGVLSELVLPRKCAGCGFSGEMLCEACRVALAQPPQRVFPNASALVPVFSMGPYAGPHRDVVLSMKERRHMAVRPFVGAVLEAGLTYLEARGEIPPRCVLVPAPTRASSARARGGDPVAQMCRATGRQVHDVLALREETADQSGLDESARKANLAGAVRVQGAPPGRVIVVDDVVTTGATLQASVAVLLAAGADVAACLTLCAA